MDGDDHETWSDASGPCARRWAFSPAWAADRDSATGATGKCGDGSYTHATSKRGACSDHGGVKDWYGTAGAPKERSEREAMPSERHDDVAKDRAERQHESMARDENMHRDRMAAGHDKVWVNTSTKVYHCEGDRWYGKTKHGEYMSQAEAREHGYRADHGKACS
ncbi:MAG TPA: DUF3761 domain-containing protein [Actinomycetota bacterium]|nr:DUF3761 domain-containing protein [Actinomycetota bacterium]